MEITNRDFNQDNICGVYPMDVNEELCYRVGRTFSAMFAAEAVVVGLHDCSLVGSQLLDALIEGLVDGGTRVIDLGQCSGVAVSLATVQLASDGGIFIEAADEFKSYCVKLVRRDSIPVNSDTGLKEIREMIAAENFPHQVVVGKKRGFIEKRYKIMKQVKKAVIPAAGLGTRFLPATKATPKEMLPIVDKPTIQYIIEEALASGIEDILIITGRSKRAIEDHFDRSLELELNLEKSGKEAELKMVKDIADIRIHYIRQKEPKGLGHAVLCAKQFIGDEPFAVLLGDDVVDSEVPALKQLIDVYDKTGSSVLGCQEVPQAKVSSYGIVASQPTEDARSFKVTDMVEKPSVEEAPSRLAVLGRYIITPAVFEILEHTAPGRGNEIQLTDALKVLAKQEGMYAYNFEGRRYDVGDKQGFLEATVEMALKRPELRDKFMEYLKGIVAE